MRYTKQSRVIKDHDYIPRDHSTVEDDYLKKKFARIIAEQKAKQKAEAEKAKPLPQASSTAISKWKYRLVSAIGQRLKTWLSILVKGLFNW